LTIENHVNKKTGKPFFGCCQFNLSFIAKDFPDPFNISDLFLVGNYLTKGQYQNLGIIRISQ